MLYRDRFSKCGLSELDAEISESEDDDSLNVKRDYHRSVHDCFCGGIKLFDVILLDVHDRR